MYSSSFIEYDTTIKYKYNHINSKKNNIKLVIGIYWISRF